MNFLKLVSLLTYVVTAVRFQVRDTHFCWSVPDNRALEDQLLVTSICTGKMAEQFVIEGSKIRSLMGDQNLCIHLSAYEDFMPVLLAPCDTLDVTFVPGYYITMSSDKVYDHLIVRTNLSAWNHVIMLEP